MWFYRTIHCILHTSTFILIKHIAAARNALNAKTFEIDINEMLN